VYRLSSLTHSITSFFAKTCLESSSIYGRGIAAASSFEVKLGRVEHVGIIEGHVVAITSKDEPHAVMHVG
jgi:hypothetical protein